MHGYWLEFSAVAATHLIAVASPGPDFAIVLRQSVVFGRRTAILTSIGIGTAILLHVGYSLLGLGLLIQRSAWWFAAVKYAGAAYLAWLGVQSLRAKPRPPADVAGGAGAAGAAGLPTARAAFATGFLTNALNPKATLFFISLFVLIVSPQTPKPVQVGYGLWMAGVTMAWFALVSVFFTRADVRRAFWRYGHWLDRTLGVVFLGFAGSLLWTAVR
jgi:RhtB (resistance to homoserine/threonine) family protein